MAWAITHGDADTQDLYLERFDGTRYLTPDGWQQAAVRRERIDIRGGSTDTVVWATARPGRARRPGGGLALALK